jgi:hypothetical protein
MASTGLGGDAKQMALLKRGDYRSVSYFPEAQGKRYVYKEESPGTRAHLGPLPLIGSVEIEYPSFIRRGFSGIKDLCAHDKERFRQLSPDIEDSGMGEFFLGVLPARGSCGLGGGVCQPLAEDYDGAVSRNLADNGPVGDEGFWFSMDRILQFMYNLRVELNLQPENVLVQRTGPEKAKPLVFDYKLVGPKRWLVRPGGRNLWNSDGVLLALKGRYIP